MLYFGYIWPFFAAIFLFLLFYHYWKSTKELRPLTPRYTEKPLLLPKRRGSITRTDIYVMLVVCLVYGVIAFTNLGDTTAAQSYWKSTSDEMTAQIDFEEPVNADTILYYPFLSTGTYSVEISTDGETFTSFSDPMDQSYNTLYKWNSYSFEHTYSIKSIRLTADTQGLELAEIGFATSNSDGTFTILELSDYTYTGTSDELINEQDVVPSHKTYMNQSYFDEIYHPRTAQEFIQGVYPYEITHPPLGKLIQALGILIFGMTPFGWRFMGTLFGVLMLPFFYILLKSMFGKTKLSCCGTLLFAFDFMHFTQTRLATVDTYSVFFTILMYLCFWYWMTIPAGQPFKKYAKWLTLSGITFGLGVCCKWTCVYAGLGLLVLYIITLILRRKQLIREHKGQYFKPHLIKTLALSVLVFIIIPLFCYTLCYIPYSASSYEGFSISGTIREMINNQSYMLNYHNNVTQEHPYQSSFYMWILNIRPILYFRDYIGSYKSAFSAFGNPLVWIGGLISIFLCISRYLRKKHPAALFIVIGYLAQLVPWMMISRTTFAYHYFPSTVFLVLALCMIFNDWIECNRVVGTKRLFQFTTICMVLFLVFYPSLSGAYMPVWYFDVFCKWLPSWPA